MLFKYDISEFPYSVHPLVHLLFISQFWWLDLQFFQLATRGNKIQSRHPLVSCSSTFGNRMRPFTSMISFWSPRITLNPGLLYHILHFLATIRLIPLEKSSIAMPSALKAGLCQCGLQYHRSTQISKRDPNFHFWPRYQNEIPNLNFDTDIKLRSQFWILTQISNQHFNIGILTQISNLDPDFEF